MSDPYGTPEPERSQLEIRLETRILEQLSDSVSGIHQSQGFEMLSARSARIHALAVALAVVRGQNIGGN